MDSGDTNHIVLTLEDDMSNQLLESKGEKKTETGPSSVELWIKSLKDANDLTDDSKSDQDNNDSCSDQDDLQLGAEATDLHKKKQRAQNYSSSPTRDSDSEDNRHWSRRARSPFLMKKLSYDQSLDSDTSGLSSIASVSSLLTSRESDPEDVLKGLGFRGPSVLDNIPDRFIHTGTGCDGVDTKTFFDSVWDESENALYGTPGFPPWVMARAGDIPKKFLQSKNAITHPSAPEFSIDEPTTHHEGVNEDPNNTNYSRLSKPQPFTSKFGTFLEPVTEEAELSSQGSVTLSPRVGKNFSFESNRSSTLKSNSHDEPSETIMRIPSLKDLWGTETTENETEHSLGEDFESSEMLNDDVVEYAPSLDLTRDEAPAVSNSQRSFPEREGSIPTLLDYFAGDGIPASEENRVAFQAGNGAVDKFLGGIADNDTLGLGEEEKDVCTAESSELLEDFKFRQPRGIKIPIPVVKISEPGGRSRKVSTILAPDPQKLVPFILEEPSTNLTPGGTDGSTSARTKTRGRQHGHDGRRNGTMQLNLYEKWVVITKTFQRQIQFSNNVKDLRRVSTRKWKMANAKIAVTKKHPRVPTQLVLPKSEPRVIERFFDVDTRCVNKRRMFKATSSAAISGSCSEDSSGFVSQATRSNSSTPENHCDQNRCVLKLLRVSPSEKAEGLTGDQVRREEKALCSCPMVGTQGKTGPVEPCSNVWRTRNGQLLKNGVSVQEELDGLQSCLKGVKVYKAGIHLMQLASSVETVISSESRPVGLRVRSSEVLLDSIQKEIKQLEEYILHLQTRLTDLKKRKTRKMSKSDEEEKERCGSDFSDVTRHLLQEQLKMFSSISNSVSPSSTPSTPSLFEGSDFAHTEDSLLQSDIQKLRKEVQLLRRESDERQSVVKNEILSEVKTEIRNCFREFLGKNGENKS